MFTFVASRRCPQFSESLLVQRLDLGSMPPSPRSEVEHGAEDAAVEHDWIGVEPFRCDAVFCQAFCEIRMVPPVER